MSLSQQDAHLIIAFILCRFYKQCFERNPDNAGLSDWSNRLNSGIASGSDVAYGFVFSQEFINRELQDSEYVTVLYKAFFGREPDTTGFESWRIALLNGSDRKDVLNGFLGAPEFTNLSIEYGIRVD